MKRGLRCGLIPRGLLCVACLFAGFPVQATPADAETAVKTPASEAPKPQNAAPAAPEFDPSLVFSEDPRQAASKLEIYGFADFTVTGMMNADKSRWRGFVNPNTTMGVGNLNVYLKGNLSERVRSLAELRFTYLPNGHAQIQSDGSVRYTDTTVRDPLELNRQMRWGGVVIERAWVEYEFHNMFVARVGQFLTPYGIWNVDHGSPTVIGIRRPFVITEPIFPERQTGLEIYGRSILGHSVLGYHLTVSNGRGIADEYVDYDSSKAVGGRAFVTNYSLGEFTLGTSFFTGKRVSKRDRWTLVEGVRTFDSTQIERTREENFAADIKWLWKAIHFQAEFLTRRREYDDRARERLNDYAYPAFVPDNRRWGTYALLGYRTPWGGLMPFVVLERTTFPTGDIPVGAAVHVGLNYRPDPALVLKVEYLHAWFPGALKTSFGVDSLALYSTQVAWVF